MLLTKDIYKVKLYGKWKMKRCVKIYHVIANKESNGSDISTRSTEQNLMSKAVNGSRRMFMLKHTVHQDYVTFIHFYLLNSISEMYKTELQKNLGQYDEAIVYSQPETITYFHQNVTERLYKGITGIDEQT